MLDNPAIDILDSTKLQDFEACRRYGMYTHLFGWKPDRPNNHLVFGSAVHIAMEHLLLHGYSAKTIIEAFDLFEAEYRKEFDSESDELFFPKVPTVLFPNLAKYCTQYKDEDSDFRTLHTEVAGSVPILYGHRIHFKLDSILQRVSTGMYSSREHKTGSRLSQAWRDQWWMKIQTWTYQHVLMCMFPPEQVEGITINGMIFTNGLKKAGNVEYERVPVKRSNMMMEVGLHHVSALANEIVQCISALREDFAMEQRQPILHMFPMNTENCGGYSGCRFRDMCLTWPNPLQYIDTVPSGMRVEFWNPVDNREKAREVMDF